MTGNRQPRCWCSGRSFDRHRGFLDVAAQKPSVNAFKFFSKQTCLLPFSKAPRNHPTPKNHFFGFLSQDDSLHKRRWIFHRLESSSPNPLCSIEAYSQNHFRTIQNARRDVLRSFSYGSKCWKRCPQTIFVRFKTLEEQSSNRSRILLTSSSNVKRVPSIATCHSKRSLQTVHEVHKVTSLCASPHTKMIWGVCW